MDPISQVYKLKKNMFISTLINYLDECTNACGEAAKSAIATDLFDYIVINKDIFDHDECSRFMVVCKNKLEELSGKKYFDADKYKKLLFPDDNKVVLCVPEPAQDTIELPKLDEHIANITAHVISPFRVIFDDYTTNKITQVKCVGDESVLDQIMGFIAERYLLSDRTQILSMLNENKTLAQIKDDQQYPNGPFLIKVNEHCYELYEKGAENVVSKGYIYNSTKSTTTINKVGKFGQVF